MGSSTVCMHGFCIKALNFLNIITGIKSRIAHGVKRKLQCECVCFVNVITINYQK